MDPMKHIEHVTTDYATARMALNHAVQAMQTAIEAAKQQHMASVKAALAHVADLHSALNAQIAGNPQLFVKPRTVSIAGVKVGLTKGKGGIAFDDPEAVVRRIEKLFADDAELLDQLLIVNKKPRKEGLLQLEVAELKKLGCDVLLAGDQVVIKPADTEVDKLVRALLKAATEDDDELEQAA